MQQLDVPLVALPNTTCEVSPRLSLRPSDFKTQSPIIRKYRGLKEHSEQHHDHTISMKRVEEEPIILKRI